MLKRIKNWIIDKWKRFKKWFIGLFVVVTVLAAAGTTLERTVEIDEPRLSEPSGLVLHLDQSDPRSYGDAGNWYDLSGHGNHGTQGTAANQPSITGSENLAGYTRKFDGVDDYVTVGDVEMGSGITGATWCVWVMPDSTTWSTDQAILGRWTSADEFLLWGDAGFDKWQVTVVDESSNSIKVEEDGNVVPSGDWELICAVLDNTTFTIYVNGVLAGTDSNATFGTLKNPARNLYIGADNDGTRFFNGSIDEVRIYNRALSAAEIQRLYISTAPKHGGF